MHTASSLLTRHFIYTLTWRQPLMELHSHLQSLVVRNEVITAIAQQPATLHVPAPPFMEPNGNLFFTRRGQPVAESILQFDSGVFEAAVFHLHDEVVNTS